MGFGSVQYSLCFVIVAVTFFNGLISLLKLVTKTIPTPYIDEIFHIPQAQRYCQNEFDKWDNKITTLPGLYLVSISILKPLEKALGLTLCSVYGLRFINTVGTFFNFFLSYSIQQKLTRTKEKGGTYVEVMSAINIAAFPPLFFFSFLYYTDVWSTAFVLLMYFFHLEQSPLLATFGIGSVFMRQTNIIWVFLLLLDSASTALIGKKKQNMTSFMEAVKCAVESLRKPFFQRVLHATSPYLIVCFFFVAFVVFNGGVVVGDRSAHSPVFHPMQNLYFLDVALFFSLPYALLEIRELLKYASHMKLLCTLWIFVALLSEYNLLEHRYLLADNRHLAFYIWRRSFGHRLIRKLLTPTYVISGISLYSLLSKQNIYFIVSLVVCVILNLTPQYLFEVRYFIIPFVLCRLHFPQRKPAILVETLFYAVINFAVFYVFLNKQFYWASEPRVAQRIIW